MKYALWSLLLLLFVYPSQTSAEEKALSTPHRSKKDRAGDCRTVCGQHEACIETRCVEMCRPSCRQGTFCTENGECAALPPPLEPILTEGDRQRLSGAESAQSTTLVFVDVGGVIGLGVKPGIEFGKKHSVILRTNLGATGLMSHAAFADNEYLRYEYSFGGSVGYRFYEATWGSLRGFYFGGGLDYTMMRLADRNFPGSHETLHGVAPFGEFGYRWVFKDISIGFGPTLALRYPIATAFARSSAPSCAGQITCDEARGRRFEGTVHFEVGWFQ